MNTSLYDSIVTVRNITRTVSKAFVWIFGLQAAILFLLASVADASLWSLFSPVLRVVLAVAVMVLAPRFFDAALHRIAHRQSGT
jgi:uncharacterized membrane protein